MGHFCLKLVQLFIKIRVQKSWVPKHSLLGQHLDTKMILTMWGIDPYTNILDPKVKLVLGLVIVKKLRTILTHDIMETRIWTSF